jgi:hypothetical protein
VNDVPGAVDIIAVIPAERLEPVVAALAVQDVVAFIAVDDVVELVAAKRDRRRPGIPAGREDLDALTGVERVVRAGIARSLPSPAASNT